MTSKRTISSNGNPFAEDVTVAPAAECYDWRTDEDYDAVEIQVGETTFKLDRMQAARMGLALINAANHDETRNEDAYYEYLAEQWEDGQDAKYDAQSTHWGHD